MNTGGDAAERLVRDSLMITEEAVKLAGLGAKNLAAILVALAKEEEKTHGPTRLTRLLRSGEELKLLPIKSEDLRQFRQACKGIRRPVLPDQKQISGQRAERYPVSGQRGGKRQPRAGAYGLPCAAGKGGGGKKRSRPRSVRQRLADTRAWLRQQCEDDCY